MVIGGVNIHIIHIVSMAIHNILSKVDIHIIYYIV